MLLEWDEKYHHKTWVKARPNAHNISVHQIATLLRTIFSLHLATYTTFCAQLYCNILYWNGVAFGDALRHCLQICPGYRFQGSGRTLPPKTLESSPFHRIWFLLRPLECFLVCTQLKLVLLIRCQGEGASNISHSAKWRRLSLHENLTYLFSWHSLVAEWNWELLLLLLDKRVQYKGPSEYQNQCTPS